jgi:hypothetical protein
MMVHQVRSTMLASRFRWVLFAAVVAACAPFAAGCAVDEEPVMVDGYRPLYHDGYVVYYDGYGRPFYYNGGATYYVAATDPRYGLYTTHYATYRGAYGRWYGAYGARYRGYRYRGYYRR